MEKGSKELLSQYYVNKADPANHRYTPEGDYFDPKHILAAAHRTDEAISTLERIFRRETGMKLFDVIDKKQTGAFVGAIFIAKTVETVPYLAKNPSQTGHPDMIPSKYLKKADAKWDQSFWDQFPYGGLEAKTSCGNLKNGLTHMLDVGQPRIKGLTGVVWKGHHNEINNLLGVFWDYIDGVPKIVAAFYSNQLVPKDFTYTVPKEGGGHTTNVCITKDSATKKLGAGWVFCMREKSYADFVSKRFGVKFPQ